MINIFLVALFAVAGIVATPMVDVQGADLMRRADTPNFYFVTTSLVPASLLKPVRFDGSRTGATLTGTGDPVQFFFEGGES